MLKFNLLKHTNADYDELLYNLRYDDYCFILELCEDKKANFIFKHQNQTSPKFTNISKVLIDIFRETNRNTSFFYDKQIEYNGKFVPHKGDIIFRFIDNELLILFNDLMKQNINIKFLVKNIDDSIIFYNTIISVLEQPYNLFKIIFSIYETRES